MCYGVLGGLLFIVLGLFIMWKAGGSRGRKAAKDRAS